MKKINMILLTVVIAWSLQAQNIGIGTNTPAEKLHVVGNIKADTVKPAAVKITPNAGLGKILTSDAMGNASWQQTNISPGNIGYGVWGDCSITGNISEYQPMADSADQNDLMGYNVSMSGNFAIVGVQRDDVSGNSSQGSALIYEFDGTQWVYKQKLVDPTGAATDNFGSSVAISGAFAIVGAPSDDVGTNANQGSACLFRFNGTSWVIQQKITDAAGISQDNFGSSVAISGNYAIIGCPGDDIGTNTNEGSATVYHYNGSSWVLKNKLTSPTGEGGDNFGSSVAVSGSLILVGTPDDDDGGLGSGSASFYKYNGFTWIFIQKISSAVQNDHYGSSVAISGNNAIVAAPGYDPVGAAFVYSYDGSAWTLADNLYDSDGAAGDNFGKSVAISDGYIIVGCNADDVGLNATQGSVIIYRQIGNSWRKLQKLSDPGGETGDGFGWSTALDAASKRFLIGAPQQAGSGQKGLVLFGKIN